MAEITSGTIGGSPLGNFWLGTLELASSVDDGDNINLASGNFLGNKVKEVVWASGIRYDSSGTVNPSPVLLTSGTANIELGMSGTYGTGSINSTTTISNQARRIQFVALSYQE